MSIIDVTTPVRVKKIIYPESDGKPMADNSKQFRWITTIEGNLEILFAHNPDVFIAGDMLWYPVARNNKISQAPDVMVVFGRPKGDRGSYIQTQEEDIAPQVVFEILSPSNTKEEMENKFNFYESYGVEEYYVYDPQRGRLQGWQRQGRELAKIERIAGWISPRLGIQFELEGLELGLYYPDGRRFLTYVELGQRVEAETEARIKAETRAEKAEIRAEAESEARAKAETRAKEFEAKLKQAGLL